MAASSVTSQVRQNIYRNELYQHSSPLRGQWEMPFRSRLSRLVETVGRLGQLGKSGGSVGYGRILLCRKSYF